MTGKQRTVERETQNQRSFSRRQFLISAPGILGSGLAISSARSQSQLQTFNGPMANAQEVYRPVKLAPKAGASPSMTPLERDHLEHKIKCQCGCVLDVFTCRTTDFSCSVSPAMHGDVLALVEGGYDAPEILAAFQSVYGERVLMAPVKSGFNLLGYAMPFIVLGTGAVVVAALIKRWRSRAPAAVAIVPDAELSATREELARLDAAVRSDA
ncbi:MAG: cytochrome c-type biogenesis protein CcmH [Gemmatimonadaceae bacterium]